MGIKSTYNIDRQTAIEVIKTGVDRCSNEQLSNMLLEFDDSYFRNYSVTEVLVDDEYPKIITISDFFGMRI